MMEREQQLCNALEAVLFAVGKAVTIEKLAEAIDCEKEETKQLLVRMEQQYELKKRGIRLKRLDESYQLCTGEEYYDQIQRVVAQPTKNVLTDAQMEVLAIIAYKQPVTKAQIDTIRGVKSDHGVNRLLECGLIEEVGRLNAPGHPILLATSQLFLKRFGVSSCADLPEDSTEHQMELDEVYQEVIV